MTSREQKLEELLQLWLDTRAVLAKPAPTARSLLERAPMRMNSSEQRLPSESGERFLGENDYRETIDRLEALLRRWLTQRIGPGWSELLRDTHAALAKPAPRPLK